MTEQSDATMRNARFVDHLVSDPANPPAVKLLTGYVGRSALTDHVRLYLDTELREYYDLPQASILHREDVPYEQNPLMPSFVWIRRDAALLPSGKELPGKEGQARFLVGNIRNAPGEAGKDANNPPNNGGPHSAAPACTAGSPQCAASQVPYCRG